MKRNVLAYLLLLVLLLTACGRWQKADMLRQLNELQAMNQADSLLTNDSLAKALASYFDDYGTPNERMLAHYLLARTYTDMGEAPQALDEYHTAADCADTTATDCDYKVLARVHAQTADLFYAQALYQQQIQELSATEKYALLANDTVIAIYSKGDKAAAYQQLGLIDSVIAIRRDVASQYAAIGYENYASMFYGALVKPMIETGHLPTAKEYMLRYETHSGLFDSDGNIIPGSEVYYNSKALYFMHCGMLDSAEYYYRKELRYGKDLNNQLMGNQGLYQLYKTKKIPDSVGKYAEAYCLLNDSMIKKLETDNILRQQQEYNYERNQRIARQKTLEAEKLKNVAWFCLVVILVLLVSIYLVYRYVRDKREKERQQYLHDLEMLEQYRSDLADMQAEQDRRDDAIAEAEEVISTLSHRIEQYELHNIDDRHREIDVKLKQTPVYERFKYLELHTKESPTADDWAMLRSAFDEIFPEFFQTLNTDRYVLSDKEYNLCMLLRLNFAPGIIANFLPATKSNISMLRSRLLQKVYGIEGKASEFDTKIREIKIH